MSVLVDTNVLLCRAQPGHPSHGAAVESVAHLLLSDGAVYVTAQNMAEFWNVATRPAASNGPGLSAALAIRELGASERALSLLPDSPDAYTEWKRLVVEHAVAGSEVHDARLLALMRVHGVRRILTFDAGDFVRYDIDVISPTAAPR